MLICAKCGGNAHVGNAWYCGLDDVLTCGDCGAHTGGFISFTELNKAKT